MSDDGLQLAVAKMHEAHASLTAIEVFSHYFQQLISGASGVISEDSITPLLNPIPLRGHPSDPAAGKAALAATVIIKLNGGLGTSMGLDHAKTLIPVSAGQSFLDLIVAQIKYARADSGARLPLVLMNSPRTRADALAVLANHGGLTVDDLPLDFLQNSEPKIRSDDFTPVRWPRDPSLEWCPPGHGDIYPALLSSGLLEKLLDRGYRYASASNADNLGAAPSAELAGWFASTGAPFALEICRRTHADLKGGHLARSLDGRLLLREIAQTAPEDLPYFTDDQRHAYFNTNNLWFDLRVLQKTLAENAGVLGLPMIRNEKSVDPSDPTSPKVIQIETAMGAAVEAFDGATAILVGRDRFLPVKTTNDLALLRSDVYELAPDAVPRLTIPTPPLVDLDPRFFRTLAAFDARFPSGVPSLRAASSFRVRGDWTFGKGVHVRGDGALVDEGSPGFVRDGTRISDPK